MVLKGIEVLYNKYKNIEGAVQNFNFNIKFLVFFTINVISWFRLQLSRSLHNLTLEIHLLFSGEESKVSHPNSNTVSTLLLNITLLIRTPLLCKYVKFIKFKCLRPYFTVIEGDNWLTSLSLWYCALIRLHNLPSLTHI